MRDAERLSSLEVENAELKARIAALEAKASPKPRPPAPVDEGVVRVTSVQTYKCTMATEAEYSALLEIVARTHPRVVPAFETDRYGSGEKYRREFLDQFISCFKRVESLWRFTGNELGRTRAEYWVNETNTMLGIRSDVGLSHVMSAAIAWGDVPYTLGRWPYDVYLGLSYSTGNDIRGASSASWKKVLESGAVRPSIMTQAQAQMARPSDVRIYGG